MSQHSPNVVSIDLYPIWSLSFSRIVLVSSIDGFEFTLFSTLLKVGYVRTSWRAVNGGKP